MDHNKIKQEIKVKVIDFCSQINNTFVPEDVKILLIQKLGEIEKLALEGSVQTLHSNEITLTADNIFTKSGSIGQCKIKIPKGAFDGLFDGIKSNIPVSGIVSHIVAQIFNDKKQEKTKEISDQPGNEDKTTNFDPQSFRSDVKFIEHFRLIRNKFVSDINSQEWPSAQRKVSAALLIGVDEAISKLEILYAETPTTLNMAAKIIATSIHHDSVIKKSIIKEVVHDCILQINNKINENDRSKREEVRQVYEKPLYDAINNSLLNWANDQLNKTEENEGSEQPKVEPIKLKFSEIALMVSQTITKDEKLSLEYQTKIADCFARELKSFPFTKGATLKDVIKEIDLIASDAAFRYLEGWTKECENKMKGKTLKISPDSDESPDKE